MYQYRIDASTKAGQLTKSTAGYAHTLRFECVGGPVAAEIPLMDCPNCGQLLRGGKHYEPGAPTSDIFRCSGCATLYLLTVPTRPRTVVASVQHEDVSRVKSCPCSAALQRERVVV